MPCRFALACLSWIAVAAAACAPEEDKTGEPCRWYGTCDGLACVAVRTADPEDLAALELACAQANSGAAPGKPCDASDECASGICLLSGACAEPCDPEFGCVLTQRCTLTYARTATMALQALNACVDRVNLPRDGTFSVTRLDNVLTEPPGSADLSIDTNLAVPSGTSLFVLEHADDDRWPVDTACRAPLCAEKLSTRTTPARVLFDIDQLDDAKEPPLNPVASDLHVYPVSVLIPNGSSSGTEPEGYSLRLDHDRAGSLRVTQLQREANGERLDLNVFYVGAKDFDVTGARGPALLADALEEVDRILGQADIYLGEVRQIEVTGSLPTTGLTLEGDGVETTLSRMTPRFGVLPLLPKLFSLSAGAGNAAINVFFVADIEMPPGIHGDIGALAGGTPVPWGMHGMASSGIVVATDMMVDANDPQSLGRTLAHELGHALGLFHTTEVDGRVLEPIDDTPACPLAQDTNGNGLGNTECAAHGGSNLMFPTSDATATELTKDQRAVLRRALILQ
jgi:hypothetical protein